MSRTDIRNVACYVTGWLLADNGPIFYFPPPPLWPCWFLSAELAVCVYVCMCAYVNTTSQEGGGLLFVFGEYSNLMTVKCLRIADNYCPQEGIVATEYAS